MNDKTAIVTGGAAGIGEACVRRFVADSAQVLIGDVNTERGKALAGELGQNAVFHPLDVADEASFVAAIDAAVSNFGKLDILVNNAGYVFPAEPVQRTTNEEFERVINTNIRGTFYGCKLAYPHLKKTKGCVLNISSMAGVTGQADHAVYAATKGAINALTKATAVDWGADGMRINALCPTGVWTDALRAWMKIQPRPDEIESYLDRIHSLGYCATPELIASVAAFLCCDDAKFVTGCIMPVSGGSECGYKL